MRYLIEIHGLIPVTITPQPEPGPKAEPPEKPEPGPRKPAPSDFMKPEFLEPYLADPAKFWAVLATLTIDRASAIEARAIAARERGEDELADAYEILLAGIAIQSGAIPEEIEDEDTGKINGGNGSNGGAH
jgi:hypothetical protein